MYVCTLVFHDYSSKAVHWTVMGSAPYSILVGMTTTRAALLACLTTAKRFWLVHNTPHFFLCVPGIFFSLCAARTSPVQGSQSPLWQSSAEQIYANAMHSLLLLVAFFANYRAVN